MGKPRIPPSMSNLFPHVNPRERCFYKTNLFLGRCKVNDLSKNNICFGKVISLIRFIATNDTNGQSRTCERNNVCAEMKPPQRSKGSRAIKDAL